MKKLIYLAPVVILVFLNSCGSGEEKKAETDSPVVAADTPATVAAPEPAPVTAEIVIPEHVTALVNAAKPITKKAQHHQAKKKVKKADNTEVTVTETITVLELVTSNEAPASAPAANAPADARPKDSEGAHYYPTTKPSFPGGEKALDTWLSNHLKYPGAALDNNSSGTVLVQFAVDETGKVLPGKVISKPLGYGLEEEALHVISEMPAWKPATVDNKPVKSKFILPIQYKLKIDN